MKIRLSKTVVVIAVIAFATAMPPTRGAGVFAAEAFRVGDPLPQVVVDAWQRRRESCRSVYWKLKSRELITKGLLNAHDSEDIQKFGPRPQQDEWRERTFETWIDIPALRARNESKGSIHYSPSDGPTRLIPKHVVNLFDGTSLQKVDVTEGNYLQEQDPKGVGQGLFFHGFQIPLFWGVGIIFGPDTPLAANQLDQRLDPRKFRITAVQRDGNGTSLTVRSNLHPTEEIFIELKMAVEREGAIVEQSLMIRGKLNRQTSVDWSQTELGWQPVSWKENSLNGDGTLSISTECEVIERSCAPDLSAVAFHFDPAVGDPYLDVKKRTSFVKSPPGQPDVPQALYDIQHGARQRRWNWLISGVIVLACLGGGVWWWRRRTE